MQPVVVGIAGGSGAGKSTLVTAILERSAVPVSCISFDDYYRDRPELDLVGRSQLNYDHPDSLDADQLAADLARLRAGRAVALAHYDFAAHRRGHDVSIIEARPLVVVDGILLLAFDGLLECFDLRVFIEASDQVRTRRRVARDVAERGRTAAFAHRQLEATVRPMYEAFVAPSARHAHLVVDGTTDVASSAERVLAMASVSVER